MNPYRYQAPPVGLELLPKPMKMRLTVRSLNGPGGSHARQGPLTQMLGVSLGIILGIFLTSAIRHLMLKPHLCLTRRSMPVYEDINDAFRIVGLDRNTNTHNSAKNLVFVGVMTAHQYLDTRAKAVYETWGRHLPGKIAFFSSETSTTSAEIPLIRLQGVDDSYPPQKKSFMMLKYMAEHFGNHFEYFMRADDDLYVRTDKLELFLRSVNSSNPHFIGQMGQGNELEFGQLALRSNENFCMGGPGVIMSRQTLLKVVPHIRDCIKNLQSTHEDVEVGRCVRKYANISCTWAYEVNRSTCSMFIQLSVLYCCLSIFMF